MLRKMAYAGTHARSFREAALHVEELADVKISEQRIMRATKGIGGERVEQRDAEAADYAALPLPEQQQSPRKQVPQMAVVMMDGGRLQNYAVSSNSHFLARSTRSCSPGRNADSFAHANRVESAFSIPSLVALGSPCQVLIS